MKILKSSSLHKPVKFPILNSLKSDLNLLIEVCSITLKYSLYINNTFSNKNSCLYLTRLQLNFVKTSLFTIF
ncbi:hypothetical protein A0H76_1147 [Hepatospora eriocheir]|uniref:Uncharacterized protein n=1 Tax=Hepatospora eriocheir TaxID=1081669 RepID=A0A1X0QHM0_9MICR|nr:hypothetical protein A0H76_1147 [Hepatospora eriocheir]